MAYDRHEVQHIAITRADGGISVMQFITKAWNAKAQAMADAKAAELQAAIDYARAGGPVVSGGKEVDPDQFIAEQIAKILKVRGDAAGYQRASTDEAIAAEIARTELPSPMVSWRRIAPEDLPQDRASRNAWRDDGKAITTNPSGRT